jgi:serine/threonine protein kinase
VRLRRLSEEMVLFYVTQVVMGLGHLHSLKYAYRDLKPENILICEDGYIKIADFGLSKKLESG